MFFTSKHEKLLNLEGTVGGGVPRMVEKNNVSVYVYSTFCQPLGLNDISELKVHLSLFFVFYIY